MMTNAPRPVFVEVVQGDALTADVDVLVLKYAQDLYGVDSEVVRALPGNVRKRLPADGDFHLALGDGAVAAEKVLFVGVPTLDRFGYREIRFFGRRALTSLAVACPTAASIAVTLHGAGYGLDEAECFRSELAGLTDAVISGEYPRDLRSVRFIEQDPSRARRLAQLVRQQLPEGRLNVDLRVLRQNVGAERAARLGSVGFDSGNKPYAFVAMPINDDTDDLFHYGIRQAIDACGLLCERIDQAPAVGDILGRIKQRIAGAAFVVAELSARNPNVYLEVGYAWGRDVPTILLIKSEQLGDLGFDVKGQRCVVYNNIKDVEAKLTAELRGLRDV